MVGLHLTCRAKRGEQEWAGTSLVFLELKQAGFSAGTLEVPGRLLGEFSWYKWSPGLESCGSREGCEEMGSNAAQMWGFVGSGAALLGNPLLKTFNFPRGNAHTLFSCVGGHSAQTRLSIPPSKAKVKF